MIASMIWFPMVCTGLKDGHRLLRDERDLRAADRAHLLAVRIQPDQV